MEGKTRHRQADRGKVMASSSTLNRLELTPADASRCNRYKKIVHHPEKLEALFVDAFLDSFKRAPKEIVLDFDATDDPVHGDQEGKFFHGYYGCYCYLPLYVTCGDHLLVAKLRTSDRDGADGSTQVLAYLVERIRARWPKVRIIVRGDSGFARDGIMAWCESHRIYYLLGLARNERLLEKIGGTGSSAGPVRTDRPRLTRVHPVSLPHPKELGPYTARHRQSRTLAQRRQSPLHRHQPPRRLRRPQNALRKTLLRPRRHGEPHQRTTTRPLRRPHQRPHDAGEPTAAVVLLRGLRPDERATPCRT
ncbi:MAG: transposase [Chloroflexi bacterium]|nr:transposase [Chloroflexota bacterium]